MPDPITIEALEALGFTINRDRDGDRVLVFAMRRIDANLSLTFFDEMFCLDYGGRHGHELPNDMASVRLAMQLFGLPEPGPKPEPVSEPISTEQSEVVAPIISQLPRGVGRPKKIPSELKNLDLRIPVTESQHATVKAAAEECGIGIATWARTILLMEANAKSSRLFSDRK